MKRHKYIIKNKNIFKSLRIDNTSIDYYKQNFKEKKTKNQRVINTR